MDGSNIQDAEEDQGNLQTRGVNPDSGGSLTRKGGTLGFLPKRTRTQRRAAAELIAANVFEVEVDPVDDTGFGYTDDFVLCLSCEDVAYDDNIYPKNNSFGKQESAIYAYTKSAAQVRC